MACCGQKSVQFVEGEGRLALASRPRADGGRLRNHDCQERLADRIMRMSGELAKTPLHAWHTEHGARMVDFAGWSMPVQYGSIVEEHVATRTAVGMFDVSHMGRLLIEGSGAAAFLDRIVTRKVVGMPLGKVRYGLVCKEDGCALDDVLVYRLKNADAEYHLLVVNASNREKIVAWLAAQLRPDEDVKVIDQTVGTVMFAVQGPKALDLVRPFCGTDPSTLGYYAACESTLCGDWAILSRTGYTGEDGIEVITTGEAGAKAWQEIFAAGQAIGLKAAGLGARDTLRLEAAMPLYGHELSETITPVEAGLDFAISMAGRTFIGQEVLKKQQESGIARTRVGLMLEGKRAAREHYNVVQNGQTIGEVTSGTFSPTLQTPIAMAFVPTEAAKEGGTVEVDIRGSLTPAKIVPLPFYKRSTT